MKYYILKLIFLGVKIFSNQFLLMLGYALYICIINVMIITTFIIMWQKVKKKWTKIMLKSL